MQDFRICPKSDEKNTHFFFFLYKIDPEPELDKFLFQSQKSGNVLLRAKTGKCSLRSQNRANLCSELNKAKFVVFDRLSAKAADD